VDEDLRRLTRCGSGGVGDFARVLLERIRSGELARERVVLAAALGDLSSGQLVPEPGRLADALGVCGKPAFVRAFVAIARSDLDQLGLPAMRGHLSEEFGDELEAHYQAALQAIEGAEEWVHCPCPRHLAVAHEAGNAGQWAFDRLRGWPEVAEPTIKHGCFELPGYAAMSNLDFSLRLFPDLVEQRGLESPEGGELLEKLALELVPWALGSGDPLADRVTARARAGADQDFSSHA